jgi:hypothetical protein
VDVLAITGTVQTTPSDITSSGLPSVIAQLAETMLLSTRSVPGRYDLTSDSPQAVSLGALTAVNFLFIKVSGGGHVRVRVTSTDGATQAVPVDSVYFSTCSLVAITAIDLTRDPGVETLVDVILGQAAQ